MSRRDQILKLLEKKGAMLTCQQITSKIIKKEKLTGNRATYLSGSISSLLRKMVKEDILKYANEEAGPRGGHVYQLNK